MIRRRKRQKKRKENEMIDTDVTIASASCNTVMTSGVHNVGTISLIGPNNEKNKEIFHAKE